MRCLVCNKFLGLQIQGVPLQDGNWICNKCFEDLGFDKKDDRVLGKALTWDLIKDGKDAYKRHQEEALKDLFAPTIKFAHYGEARDIDATDEEMEVFKTLSEIVAPVDIELKRVSDSYLTAKLGEWDLARFKFTDRTAWILFPTLEKASEKHKIDDPDDLWDLEGIIDQNLAHIEKYSK